jgi:hypothetical protein
MANERIRPGNGVRHERDQSGPGGQRWLESVSVASVEVPVKETLPQATVRAAVRWRRRRLVGEVASVGGADRVRCGPRVEVGRRARPAAPQRPDAGSVEKAIAHLREERGAGAGAAGRARPHGLERFAGPGGAQGPPPVTSRERPRSPSSAPSARMAVRRGPIRSASRTVAVRRSSSAISWCTGVP